LYLINEKNGPLSFEIVLKDHRLKVV